MVIFYIYLDTFRFFLLHHKIIFWLSIPNTGHTSNVQQDFDIPTYMGPGVVGLLRVRSK